MPPPHDEPGRPIDWSQEFPPASLAAWQEQLARELRGKDPASLVRSQEDGFALAPLQTEADASDLPHLATGADTLLRVRGPGSAALRQRIIGPSPDGAAHQIERALEDGADELELSFDPVRVRRNEPFEPRAGDEERGDVESARELALADLPADVFDGDGALPEPRGLIVATLDDLRTVLAPVSARGSQPGPRIALKAGPATPAIVAGLQSVAPATLAFLEAGYDPVGHAARGELEGAPFDAHWGEAADLVAFFEARGATDARALTADGQPFHVAGATPAQEIAALLCGSLMTLRSLEALGHAPAVVARHLVLRTELSTTTLMTAAKIRALRLAWGRVVALCGLDAGDPAYAARIVGTTSLRNRSRTIDLRTNLVRSTLQSFGGMVGGCDAVGVLPDTLDAAALNDGDWHTARGQVHLLREESALGRVADPLGGSYAVERLTDELGRAAWALVRTIEGAGGFATPAGRSTMCEEIRRAANARNEAFRRRERVLVGISQFADPDREDVRAQDDRIAKTESALAARLAQRGESADRQARLDAVEHADARSGQGVAVHAEVAALEAGATFGEVLRARRRQVAVPKPDAHGCSSAEPWPLHPGEGGDAVSFEMPRLLARLLSGGVDHPVVRVRVALLLVGDNPKLVRARAGFAEDLWRVAGAETVQLNVEGSLDDAHALADACAGAIENDGASLACLCTTDDSIPSLVPPLAERLTNLGPPVDLYVAAPPTDPALDPHVTRFLHRGMDVVEFLDEAWVEQLARQAGQSLTDPEEASS